MRGDLNLCGGVVWDRYLGTSIAPPLPSFYSYFCCVYQSLVEGSAALRGLLKLEIACRMSKDAPGALPAKANLPRAVGLKTVQRAAGLKSGVLRRAEARAPFRCAKRQGW